MPRSLVVGNGNILVNIDNHLQVRDFYYPYVGQQNHVGGHFHRWGLWVDGRLLWSTDAGWKTGLSYKKDILVTESEMIHEDAKLQVVVEDFVHYEENIFVRHFRIKNLSSETRTVRLFAHHDFHLYQDEVGDTVCYIPKKNALVHYKRKRYMLIAGMTSDKEGMRQYTTGQKNWTHDEGSWRDAEDGELSLNPIAQGAVDSACRFDILCPPHKEKDVYLWIIAGKNFEDVFKKNDSLIVVTPSKMQEDTENFWRSWVNKQEIDFKDLDDDLVSLYKTGLLIVRAHSDNRGAITAANDSDNLHYNKDSYSYMWPRDGALVALALDKAGYHELTRRFFKFCRPLLTKQGFLLHKFNPDGSLGSSWHPWILDGKPSDPIQEDETALVLYSLWKHYEFTKDIEFVKPFYHDMVIPMGDFLASYRDSHTKLPKPSYDLWEEQHGIFTFTTSTVVAALHAAAKFAELFGDSKRKDFYYRASEEVREAMLKHLYSDEHGRFAKKALLRNGNIELDMTVDASLFSVFYFGILAPDDPRVVSTMNAIKEKLSVAGGIARYENDYYHRKNGFEGPGNPWIICTLWVADWYIQKATTHEQLKPAKEIFQWVRAAANEAGVLPEQLDPDDKRPLSVAPLTWSHSSYVASVLDYISKYDLLTEQAKSKNGSFYDVHKIDREP
ncbi:glycoside hydrolase family 15 protein [Candidatus Woesearchaeota archaeon]|nr:MAG: glycoside hydrolase family 15 protein [Candidatus Woesearchaeota archaeon]